MSRIPCVVEEESNATGGASRPIIHVPDPSVVDGEYCTHSFHSTVKPLLCDHSVGWPPLICNKFLQPTLNVLTVARRPFLVAGSLTWLQIN